MNLLNNEKKEPMNILDIIQKNMDLDNSPTRRNQIEPEERYLIRSLPTEIPGDHLGI